MEDGAQTERRYTVADAAEALGISAEAVRMRLKRGTLRSEREEGAVYVLLDPDLTRPHGERSSDQSGDQTALISSLEDQVRFLREELARKDAIMLNMTEAMKSLEAPESPEPRPDRATPTDPSEGAQQATQRPWWQRLFGG